MAVELLDYVPSLLREVRPPGSTLFSTVGDADWVGYLSDAFWEARLDGFLAGYVAEGTAGEDDWTIEPTSGTADIDRKDIALVILYAGIKVLSRQILNMSGGFRAKAGSVEFEQNASLSNVLAEMLKQLRATKDRIIDELETGTTGVAVIDTFSTRLFDPYGGYWGDPGLAG